MENVEFHYVETNGITLHTAQAGPEDGPLAILLHGFPEFWYGWRHQIEPLAEAGYRVIVPDQRGYNLSDKPQGVKNYELNQLRDDVTGLIEASGREKAVIFGHDWGGVVAWYLAATKPEFVKKLLIVNVPYLGAARKALLRYPPQLLKSSYMLFFQIPRLPEKIFRTNDFEEMKKGIAASGREGAFTEEDMEHYKEAWSQEGALTAMLNWYRALRYARVSEAKIKVPVRIIWGIGDSFLHPETAKASIDFCENGELIFVGQATHWVNHEQPAIVNQLIHEFVVPKSE
ncbi:alpha/beta fold hydrolase [Alkalicoccus halolimnae]|uniref:Alpha/beta hydrolase n=1 Tax=Alkalicoccus halolimnae TaxID=1667239 RepID=A0A5C7F1X6_9BACI|nr:alpha/beta hydrolase [Alkalicoccus halolimnae]TXF83682.1 alpha/beta hydrolase [Alkalicoccus halolimnae]